MTPKGQVNGLQKCFFAILQFVYLQRECLDNRNQIKREMNSITLSGESRNARRLKGYCSPSM